jgi:polar amino acid transport system substrate-binding protein
MVKHRHFLALIISLLTLTVTAGCLTGCGKATKIKDLSQLGDKVFAVPVGTIADQLVLSRFPEATFLYYGNVLDACMAVKSGEADAAAYDEPILRNIAGKYTEMTVLPDRITTDYYGFAVKLGDEELKKAIDDTVAEIKSNGIYDAMLSRWLPDEGLPADMPEIALESNGGTLKFGTAAITEPFSFYNANQEIVGFDIELAMYVAKKLGMQLEIVNLQFGELLPAVVAGDVDFIGACITISEERAKTVLFSEPYYTGGIAALVMK